MTYHDYAFNFRDQIDGEECNPCPDTAYWPDPRPGNAITEKDDLDGNAIRAREALGWVV